MGCRFLLHILFCCALTWTCHAVGVPVFSKGEAGYFCIKIPALVVTKNGTLLAFAEARRGSCSDYTETDLVQKRSFDGGFTWTNISVVAGRLGQENNVFGQATPVLLPSGEVLLPYCLNNTWAFVITSKDDGGSWSLPLNISYALHPSWRWFGTGPPGGIVLQSGRIVIPAYHGPFHWDDGTITHGVALMSDDGGATWRRGASLGGLFTFSNECQSVQLSNGTLLLNSRGVGTRRLQTLSFDEGETWGNTRVVDDLPEPFDGCEGSILRHASQDTLYFSNPTNTSFLRFNMTIHVSTDHGSSWQEYLVIDQGRVGYSSLQLMLNDREIAMLYEHANHTGKIFVPDAISFYTFPTKNRRVY